MCNWDVLWLTLFSVFSFFSSSFFFFGGGIWNNVSVSAPVCCHQPQSVTWIRLKIRTGGISFQKKKKRNVSSYAMTETMLELKEFRRWKKRKYFSFLSETLAKEAVVLVKALRSKLCVWTHKNVENCTNNCSLIFFSIRIRWCGNVYTSSTSSLKKSF